MGSIKEEGQVSVSIIFLLFWMNLFTLSPCHHIIVYNVYQIKTIVRKNIFRMESLQEINYLTKMYTKDSLGEFSVLSFAIG